jgi:hypothetical protein
MVMNRSSESRKERVMRNVIEHLLGEMGATLEQVRETLLAAGCKGQRGECCTCPVALYFGQHFPGVTVIVTSRSVRIDGWVVRLTPAVGLFVLDFDRGRYEELEGKVAWDAS